jgi:cleavage stimulation factor subunit 2
MMNLNLAQPTMASPPVQADMQPQDETEQQKALLMQVLQLTDEQINALPPQHRDQIRQLVS